MTRNEPIRDGLIPMTNGRETIRSHADQVPLWRAQGWEIVAEEAVK